MCSRRWEQAKNGEGPVVLLSGEAGIGKKTAGAGEARGWLGEHGVWDAVSLATRPFLHVLSLSHPVDIDRHRRRRYGSVHGAASVYASTLESGGV